MIRTVFCSVALRYFQFGTTLSFTKSINGGKMTTVLIILALLLLFVGVLGVIHPLLPSMPLMFAGTWLLAYSQNYEVIGSMSLAVLGLIMAVAWLLDYVSGLLGAKFSGASKQALWGSLAGGVVGLFFALPGMVLGPLVGAAAGEFMARRSLWAAGKVSLGTLLGFVAGVVAKLGCALVVLFSIFGLYVYHWLS